METRNEPADFLDFVENGTIKKGTWSKKENHRIYADWLFDRLGYKTPEDRYRITLRDFRDNYGAGLLQHRYQGSIIRFMQSVYPESQWLPWKFNSTPHGYWSDEKNHRKYADWLSEELGFKSMEDWYSISKDIIGNNYGAGLLSRKFSNCPSDFVMKIYPEHKWLPWKFVQAHKGYWSDGRNHRKYADWLSEELGFKSMEDWYAISVETIYEKHGRGLIQMKYNGCLWKLLSSVYPKYEWLPWKFNNTPRGYWSDEDNHRKYADWLSKELGHKSIEDWYNTSRDDIRNCYGGGLMHYYNNSTIEFVMGIYSEHEWLYWKFLQVPHGYWSDENNHRIYADWLCKQLGYQEREDWYEVTIKDITEFFGAGLLNSQFRGSPYLFISSVYPEHEWFPWKFTRTTIGYWSDEENHRKYADWLFEDMGYKVPEDWYNISVENIYEKHGRGLLQSRFRGSPYLFISSVYPEHEWEKSKFRKNYSLMQIEWLEYMRVSVPDIRHALNNTAGEYAIPNSRYSADGYSEAENLIAEYDGD
jgi:hypothetical protein